IDMTVLSRSCDDNIIDEMILVFDRLAKVTEADVEHTDRYPGWVYTGSSKLCDDYCRVYNRLTCKDAKIMAIHAGLECGLIRHELPDLDVISIGPDMTNIHTPDEAMDLASFKRTYDLVVELLKV
ncbi:MAG: M20/M25/M40 family metallo-hydrolase, partial [Clostridia bacterium]|nr:M20/M25/M40 family metallo-hydrolase [Clostridia bacterium]